MKNFWYKHILCNVWDYLYEKGIDCLSETQVELGALYSHLPELAPLALVPDSILNCLQSLSVNI